jgi:hypothetical protein
MNLTISHLAGRTAGLAFGLALALDLAASRAPAVAPGKDLPASPAPAAAPALAPKAVFTEDLPNGKDPFFPQSRRRARVQAPADVAAPPPPPQLFLKGISRGKERRLAVINNITVAEGEKIQLHVNAQTVVLHCLEVRERSVLVSLEGDKEVKELHLRKEI